MLQRCIPAECWTCQLLTPPLLTNAGNFVSVWSPSPLPNGLLCLVCINSYKPNEGPHPLNALLFFQCCCSFRASVHYAAPFTAVFIQKAFVGPTRPLSHLSVCFFFLVSCTESNPHTTRCPIISLTMHLWSFLPHQSSPVTHTEKYFHCLLLQRLTSSGLRAPTSEQAREAPLCGQIKDGLCLCRFAWHQH